MRKDLNRAEVRIQQPDEIDIATLQLFDDGMHGDGASGDGIYANIWNSAGASGEYYVDVISWDGLNQRGEQTMSLLLMFLSRQILQSITSTRAPTIQLSRWPSTMPAKAMRSMWIAGRITRT